MKMLKCLAISAMFCLMWMLPEGLWAQGEGDPTIAHITPIVDDPGGTIIADCSEDPSIVDNIVTVPIQLLIADVPEGECTCMYLGVYDRGLNRAPLEIIPIEYSDFTFARPVIPEIDNSCQQYKTTVTFDFNYDPQCGSGNEFGSGHIDLILLARPDKELNYHVPFHEVANRACLDRLFPPGCFNHYNTILGDNDEPTYAHDDLHLEGLPCCEENEGAQVSNSFMSPGLGSNGLTYTNPVNDLFEISIPVDDGELNLDLFNLKGQPVWQRRETVFKGSVYYEIPTDHLAPGIYFFRIRQGTALETLRLIKM